MQLLVMKIRKFYLDFNQLNEILNPIQIKNVYKV